MALNIFVDGTIIEAEPHNENFDSFKIVEIYSGTDLDFDLNTSSTETGNLDTQTDKTFTISSANLKKADYVVIEIIGRARTRILTSNVNSGFCSINLKLTKDPLGTPSVLLNQLISESQSSSGSDRAGESSDNTHPMKYYLELTADDKTDGVSINIELDVQSTATIADYQPKASFTNSQIVFTLKG